MAFYKCYSCKKIFELDKTKTSLYDPTSFIRMAICPHCRVPRQVVEIKKLSKYGGVEDGKSD